MPLQPVSETKDEPAVLSSDQIVNGAVAEQEGVACLCLEPQRQRSGSGFGTKRRRVMGSFLQKGGWAQHRHRCQLADVLCVCLSVSQSAAPQSASTPQDGSNLEIGSTTNKAELQRAEAVRERRQKRMEVRAGDIHLNLEGGEEM